MNDPSQKSLGCLWKKRLHNHKNVHKVYEGKRLYYSRNVDQDKINAREGHEIKQKNKTKQMERKAKNVCLKKKNRKLEIKNNGKHLRRIL